MSSSTPIVRQVSWLRASPPFVILFGAIAAGRLIVGPDGVMIGTLACVAYVVGSRRLIAKDHRAGIKFVKQQRFNEAIQKFTDSLAFFDRHPWVDRFRSVTLMSPSAASYREMALLNMAFCYGQLGIGEQSRRYYRQCLDRFPESGMATAAPRMLDSVTAPATN